MITPAYLDGRPPATPSDGDGDVDGAEEGVRISVVAESSIPRSAKASWKRSPSWPLPATKASASGRAPSTGPHSKTRISGREPSRRSARRALARPVGSEPSATFKSLLEGFARHPGGVPSDLVSRADARGRAASAGTRRGLVVAPEHGCSPCQRGDCRYSRSVEPRIVVALGAVRGPCAGRCFAGRRRTDIEHAVALSEVRDSGLCTATRRRFACAPLNLTLAGPDVNRNLKKRHDTAQRTPSTNRCRGRDNGMPATMARRAIPPMSAAASATQSPSARSMAVGTGRFSGRSGSLRP